MKDKPSPFTVRLIVFGVICFVVGATAYNAWSFLDKLLRMSGILAMRGWPAYAVGAIVVPLVIGTACTTSHYCSKVEPHVTKFLEKALTVNTLFCQSIGLAFAIWVCLAFCAMFVICLLLLIECLHGVCS